MMIAPHIQSCNRAIATLPAKLLITTLLISVSAPGIADFWNPTPLEWALMPDYCKAKMSTEAYQTGNSNRALPISEAQISYWERRIGPDFRHMHHFCRGLAYLTEAERPSNDRAGWAYVRAEAEIAYTINASQPTAPLWLEMNIAQARARAGLGKFDEALAQLAALQEHYPKNPDVYVAAAQTLEKAGKIDAAIDALEKGRKQVTKEGPLLFYLARYYYDVGNIARAAEITVLAEAAGMKMDSLRERLGSNSNSRDMSRAAQTESSRTGRSRTDAPGHAPSHSAPPP